MDLEIDRLGAWHPTRTGRTPVLDQITFHLASGSLGVVLGPSGSGKTTLLRTVAGLHRDSAGSIRLGGRELTGIPPERRRIGLVPQDGALFPHLTVTENIDFGLPRNRRRGSRTVEMLELLGLRELADRRPHELSGGQAQRVAVARALAPAPRLMFLDEPFSALDAGLRGEVRDGVLAALAETRTTTLLVTHDQGEAMSSADQLIVLADGRIRQSGPSHEVYTRPVDPWTAQFLGDANLLDGDSDGTTASTALGELPHAPAPPGLVTVLIRPERLRLTAASPPNAVVVGLRYFGHDALAELGLDGGGALLARLDPDELPEAGARIGVSVMGTVQAFARR